MIVPTIITPAQYRNAMFAVNRENGDHWLFWASDNSTVIDRKLWIGRDRSALNESYANLDGAVVKRVVVVDANGQEEEIEAWWFKAKQKQIQVNRLDLKALAEGEVKWY